MGKTAHKGRYLTFILDRLRDNFFSFTNEICIEQHPATLLIIVGGIMQEIRKVVLRATKTVRGLQTASNSMVPYSSFTDFKPVSKPNFGKTEPMIKAV